MKITIEKNNDITPYTIIWHDERYNFIAECDGSQVLYNDSFAIFDSSHNHIATALPPLPRKPTANDAWLLYLYKAHHLHPVITHGDINDNLCNDVIVGFKDMHDEGFFIMPTSHGVEYINNFYLGCGQITHCVDSKTKERVDVAIVDKESV